MRNKILVLIASLIVLMVAFTYYYLYMKDPVLMVYRFNSPLKAEVFIYYKVPGANELSEIENVLFLNINKEGTHIYECSNDISSTTLPLAFKDLSKDSLFTRFDQFKNNGINLFRDTSFSVEDNIQLGLISFYINDSIGHSEEVMHLNKRDSLIQEFL